MRIRTVAAFVAALVIGMTPTAAQADHGGSGRCAWTQWGQGPGHDGLSCVAGQRGPAGVAEVVFDAG